MVLGSAGRSRRRASAVHPRQVAARLGRRPGADEGARGCSMGGEQPRSPASELRGRGVRPPRDKETQGTATSSRRGRHQPARRHRAGAQLGVRADRFSSICHYQLQQLLLASIRGESLKFMFLVHSATIDATIFRSFFDMENGKTEFIRAKKCVHVLRIFFIFLWKKNMHHIPVEDIFFCTK